MTFCAVIRNQAGLFGKPWCPHAGSCQGYQNFLGGSRGEEFFGILAEKNAVGTKVIKKDPAEACRSSS
jgi:hypothetical protein